MWKRHTPTDTATYKSLLAQFTHGVESVARRTLAKPGFFNEILGKEKYGVSIILRTDQDGYRIKLSEVEIDALVATLNNAMTEGGQQVENIRFNKKLSPTCSAHLATTGKLTEEQANACMKRLHELRLSRDIEFTPPAASAADSAEPIPLAERSAAASWSTRAAAIERVAGSREL